MESDNKLREIVIKSPTYFYFDGIIKFEDIDLDDILIDEESYENMSVYNISYKALIGGTPLLLLPDKISSKKTISCYKYQIKRSFVLINVL